ncbi:hypothetical protein THERMOS_1625 [Bathymodiolus thermophilus thioautotrophic gill symbiont]|uniref:Uncharacterized protein n=1 Tax=Bathymodiolus thermophilus thioautotrophic gill symbiont TaxID=2360 RepID=A0A8H8XCR3_9GAMM|nr:hypothetical protein THERMOS_1625 [Bathymodiolus thermophilus thioautotrophic gill symbiont]
MYRKMMTIWRQINGSFFCFWMSEMQFSTSIKMRSSNMAVLS